MSFLRINTCFYITDWLADKSWILAQECHIHWMGLVIWSSCHTLLGRWLQCMPCVMCIITCFIGEIISSLISKNPGGVLTKNKINKIYFHLDRIWMALYIILRRHETIYTQFPDQFIADNSRKGVIRIMEVGQDLFKHFISSTSSILIFKKNHL